ncbi:MAG: hypothetical protein CL484_08735 [Acidobacteria bacterium]|nr:hypothetical protein [Acidobacteriota bacterium]|tara:strand:- start:6358 stop:7836 length:1479 start_codon:yes stop_codon:yes gene_type:complete
MTTSIQFDNSYGRLPGEFYTRQHPVAVAEPRLVRLNRSLADSLGIDPDWLSSKAGCLLLAGNSLPAEADPLACVYAGDQFGRFNPKLGDGRALLIGEVIAQDGERYDLQLKGSGKTPYSRGGDGRSPLGPVLREFIVSEAMHALGVPTTRSLAAVCSGESVFRQEALPGAVLCRVARSHIRFGTVQFFAACENFSAVKQLVEYVIDRHYPESRTADNPVHALFKAVIKQQAKLIASWQLVGFIHGVMNTDNMLLSGETVDYGPCAFMDAFRADAVFSSIDHGGRYAYRNQPGIAHWNLGRLLQAALPLLDHKSEAGLNLAQGLLDEFEPAFSDAYTSGLGAKFGLEETQQGDIDLTSEFLVLLSREQGDFTLAFRRLADLVAPESEEPNVGELFEFSEAYQSWLKRWKARSASDSRDPRSRQRAMYAVNPSFIPRNHLIEAAIHAAVTENDFGRFHSLVDVLSDPFSYRPQLAGYAMAPRQEEVVHQTFCGT